MKKFFLVITLLVGLTITQASAQTEKKSGTTAKKERGAGVGVSETRPVDSAYLHHPYYNGDPQYTDADTMYKYGRFPWPLVKAHPENYRYDPKTGKWETLVTPNRGDGNAKKERLSDQSDE